VDVVEVASCLQFRVSKSLERRVGFGIAALLDVPARAFRAKVHTKPERHCRNESRAKLQSPRNRTGILDGKIGREAEENAKGGPLSRER
jgi:hypothetical protein